MWSPVPLSSSPRFTFRTPRWSSGSASRAPRGPWSARLAYPLGFAAGAAFLPLYAAYLTGNPLTLPLAQHLAHVGSELLPATAGPVFSANWANALVGLQRDLVTLNVQVLGWVVGSLLLAALHVTSGSLDRRDRGALLLLVALVLAQGVQRALLGTGADGGPWLVLLLPLTWLGARGWGTLVRLLESRVEDARPRVAALVGMSLFTGTALFVPWRALAEPAPHPGLHGEYRRLLEAGDFGRGLVLIQADDPLDYASAFVLNEPLGLGEDAFDPETPIFAWDRDPSATALLLLTHPDRERIYIAGPSRTGGEVLIVERAQPELRPIP